MALWEAFILGVVQGLTEFLPVSSSGHLVIFQDWLGVSGSMLTFDVMVHCGTLIAVLIALKDDWLPVLWGSLGRRDREIGRRRLLHLLVGSVPVAFVGLLFKDALVPLFASPGAVGWLLLGTGAILWIAERWAPAVASRNLDTMGAWDALLIGCGQALAVLPGISRAGATTGTGLLRGLEREAAARFAFLLAIPAILGATLLELPTVLTGGFDAGLPIFVGSAAAAASGYGAISFFLRFMRRGSLRGFSYYTWTLGLIVLFFM